MICHYWFLNHGFKFQDFVRICRQDLTISFNITDIAIITVKSDYYCCIIHNISKSEAIRLFKNSVLENLGYIYRKYYPKFQSTQSIFFFFILLYLK